MTRYAFRIAEKDDDEQLLLLMRHTPMDGNISLAFLRQPSFFMAERAGSTANQTIICEDRETGEVVAAATNSKRRMYINKEEVVVGYLHNLRILPRVRGSTVLARGIRFFKSIERAGGAPYYVMSIMEDNKKAINALTSGRAGLPKAKLAGTFITYLIPIKKRRNKKRGLEDNVRCGSNEDLCGVIAAVNEWNRNYQLAPIYNELDFEDRRNIFPNFSLSDLLLLDKAGNIYGTLGVWNQTDFKQVVVSKYSKFYSIVRPFCNMYARVCGLPLLPTPGSKINFLHGTLLSATENDLIAFEKLLRSACIKWSGREYDYLLIGLDSKSPLTCVAKKYSVRSLKSLVYFMSLSTTTSSEFPNEGNIHLELATL